MRVYNSFKPFNSKSLVIHLLVLSYSYFAGCSPTSFSEKTVENSGLVASINGSKITRNQLEEELNIQKKKYRIDSDKKIEVDELILLKAKAMNEIIRTELFRQEAAVRNITVTITELKRAMEDVRLDYHDEVSLQKIFHKESVKIKDWENKMRDFLLAEKLIKEIVSSGTKIDEKTLKRYFEHHLEEFKRSEQVRALHIMVASEEEALRIHKKLEDGVERFAELAIQYSLGPEGRGGGDLGYFEAGRMPEEFDSVFHIKLNKVSDVIQTPYGYHILKVIGKKPARDMKFEEARNIILEKLTRKIREETFQNWLRDIRSDAIIEINQDAVDKIG